MRTTVIGRVGGPGTFWGGYEYSLGTYRFYWIAYLRGWIHVKQHPMRAVRFTNAEFLNSITLQKGTNHERTTHNT